MSEGPPHGLQHLRQMLVFAALCRLASLTISIAPH